MTAVSTPSLSDINVRHFKSTKFENALLPVEWNYQSQDLPLFVHSDHSYVWAISRQGCFEENVFHSQSLGHCFPHAISSAVVSRNQQSHGTHDLKGPLYSSRKQKIQVSLSDIFLLNKIYISEGRTSPCTQSANWECIRGSLDVHDVYWTVYVRSI